MIGVKPDSEPFLARIAFQPNKYSGNTLVNGRNAFEPSAGGFKSEALPAEWSEPQERTRFKPLVPDDVGPDWMSSSRAKSLPAGKSGAAKKPKS